MHMNSATIIAQKDNRHIYISGYYNNNNNNNNNNNSYYYYYY